VLRRIMRRAMRHAHIIGCKDPLMFRLVPVLAEEMGAAFPELLRAGSLIAETLKREEEKFRVTLDRGLRLLDEAQSEMRGTELPGEVAFRLYDTYGFPLDLTQDALRAKGLTVDVAGFEAAMERQREEARAAWAGSGEAATEAVWFAIRDKAGATDFLGYETDSAEAQILALVRDGESVARLEPGQEGAIVTNQSPFYGESGGQVGDVGVISAGAAHSVVTDTQKKAGDVHVHLGRLHAALWPWAMRRSSRSIPPAGARRARTIQRRISCTRRCAGLWAITSCRKARLSGPTVCALISVTRSR